MTFRDCDDDGDIISDGPASIVTRIESGLPTDRPTKFIAVKTSSIAHANEPHDIVKEARLLAALSHPNIIPLIDQELSEGSLSFRMPYIPYSLDELLRFSGFSPHPIISFGNPSPSSPTPREVQFIILAKSIIFQVLCGVSYLHSEHVQIAHRDIKPGNVLLTTSGRPQIIDFGIAFQLSENGTAKARDLWPELTERMYFEVSTGPYRAPELLFGPRTYDAFAIDAWSLGATLAEFFTSLLLGTDEDEGDAELSFLTRDRMSSSTSSSKSSTGSPALTPPPTPFVIPGGTRPRPGIPTGHWTRASLFDASRGELGLAWSIFKIRGTPNQDTWPSFLTLPDAGKLSFVDVNTADLGSFLPNLPSSDSSVVNTRTHTPSADPVPSALDLIHRFLMYEPSRRLHPLEALSHPWFESEPGLVLPTDVDNVDGLLLKKEMREDVTRHAFTLEGQTLTLGDLLQRYIVSDKGKS